MLGKRAMMGWSASTLQSSTRSGLVSMRRWQSAHIWDLTGSSSRRRSLMYSGRQRVHQHFKRFRVDQGMIGAQHLSANLMELPVAPLLRPLAAEHGAEIVELLDAALV